MIRSKVFLVDEDVKGSECSCLRMTFLLTLLMFSCSSCSSSPCLNRSSSCCSRWYEISAPSSPSPMLLVALHEKCPMMDWSQLDTWRTWRLSRLQMVTPSVGWRRRSLWYQETEGSEEEWTWHWSSRPHLG